MIIKARKKEEKGHRPLSSIVEWGERGEETFLDVQTATLGDARCPIKKCSWRNRKQKQKKTTKVWLWHG